MREIKFRAWDLERKNWVNAAHISLLVDGSIYDPIQKLMNPPFEVTQCIGMKDKDGNDIYEGDVVTWSQGVCRIVSPVQFSEHTTGFFPFSRTTQIPTPDADDCTIIGNIYENPEVLAP